MSARWYLAAVLWALVITAPAFAQSRDPLYCLYWGCNRPPFWLRIDETGIGVPQYTESAAIKDGHLRSVGAPAGGIALPDGRRWYAPQWDAKELDALDVTAFKLTGNTVYSAKDLEYVLKPAIGRGKTLQDVSQAAMKLRGHYRQNGMLFAQVWIPEQPIRDGVIELLVMEGRVGSVQINTPGTAEAEAIARRIRELLLADEILSERDISICELYFYAQADLEFQMAFVPSKKVGFADVTIDIKRMVK